MGVAENVKLTVVGAGSVGASLAYSALIRGTNVRIVENLVVLDVTSKPPGTIEWE